MPRVIVYGRRPSSSTPSSTSRTTPDVAANARTLATELTVPTPSHAPYLDSEDGWRINDAHFDEVTITETLVQ